jgi:hypothetical protein
MERTARMTPGSTSSGPDDARAAWNLAQLARLAEAVGELGQGVREKLDGFAPDELHEEGGATLDAERWDAVLDDVCALRDTAEQVGMIGGSFTPRGRRLDADVEEIANAAASALMEGGSELWMVELAVRLLDRERGFPALADAIEIDPLGCVAGWGETTVDALLGSFHGGDAGRTAYVCGTAGVSSDARWSSLGFDALRRICKALRAAVVQP